MDFFEVKKKVNYVINSFGNAKVLDEMRKSDKLELKVLANPKYKSNFIDFRLQQFFECENILKELITVDGVIDEELNEALKYPRYDYIDSKVFSFFRKRYFEVMKHKGLPNVFLNVKTEIYDLILNTKNSLKHIEPSRQNVIIIGKLLDISNKKYNIEQQKIIYFRLKNLLSFDNFEIDKSRYTAQIDNHPPLIAQHFDWLFKNTNDMIKYHTSGHPNVISLEQQVQGLLDSILDNNHIHISYLPIEKELLSNAGISLNFMMNKYFNALFLILNGNLREDLEKVENNILFDRLYDNFGDKFIKYIQ